MTGEYGDELSYMQIPQARKRHGTWMNLKVHGQSKKPSYLQLGEIQAIS